MGKDEACCGGRAYDMGYKGEFVKFAENANQAWTSAGVKTVVTSCSDCYHAFNRLYPPLGAKFEIFHTVQYLDRLIKEGKIKLTNKVPMKVTYHDPCHLGRLSEPWIYWNGKTKVVLGGFGIYDPPRKQRRGANGVYEIPRDIINSIHGLD